MTQAIKLLDRLNAEYAKLHSTYEKLFWISYMGDHTVDKKMNSAQKARDVFRANPKLVKEVESALKNASKEETVRLNYWLKFFDSYQAPKEAQVLKNKIAKLESVINKKTSSQKEGYIDPYTKKFVIASRMKMGAMVSTENDEKLRKACFDARERLSLLCLEEFVELVALRNQFAKTLGYQDFYDYKVQREDGMTKAELFKIFDDIHNETKHALDDIRKLEADSMPGLRKPWNFGHMMAGDFTKEEDQYFQFDEALIRWGRSYSALGIDFRGSTIQLDLADRKGKWANGFCHWPELVTFKNGKRIPGSSNFTCDVVFGQIGSGSDGYETLFHEGGHCAHVLNIEMQEVCMNHEYAPMSTAWTEVQSMFLDTMFSSFEWKDRYAKNAKGESYPIELFEKILRKMHILNPLGQRGVIFVSNFEKSIYEAKKLNPEKVKEIARATHKKYYDQSVPSFFALSVPHIYGWESACMYHGYGLADLGVSQWREYFYKKYGYIVDNKEVAREMANVWALGASRTLNEFMVLATGRKLSPDAWITSVNHTIEDTLKIVKKRVSKLKTIPEFKGRVMLNGKIKMVDGKKTISTNVKSYEDMALKYKVWLNKKLK